MSKLRCTIEVPTDIALVIEVLARDDGGNVGPTIARMLQAYLSEIENYTDVTSEVERRIANWLN